MTNIYDTATTKIKNAIAAVYENKRDNKKDNISGDYSSDTESYPTVKAVKGALADKVNVSDIKDNLTSTDTDKPLSAKQGKELKYLIDNIDTSDKTVNVTKQTNPDTGYAATYVITQGGSQVGVKINILKDRMVRSVSIETVGSTPTQEETDAGLDTGDEYILFVVATADSDTPTHLILPVTDIFDLQRADETTLTLSQGIFSIKIAGVDTSQLKDGAVTADKIASAVKSSWLTTSDVQSEISSFCDELAEAINPSTP